jgi:hypothetical protein
MSRIREVVARMAVDPVFAEQVRSHPDEVALAYGLNADEIDKLRGLAAADAQSGPAPLGARLSKSGITGGLLAGFLAGAADPMATAEGGDVSEGGDISKPEFVVFDPQPDPPGGPHVAEAALGGPDTIPGGDSGDDNGYIVHWTPDPDAFDYGAADTQPADGSDDGGIIIEWTPDSDAFDYGIPDTQPDPADGAYDGPDIQPGGDAATSEADAKGMIIHGEPVPNDGAYEGPDIQPSVDPDPNDAEVKGIIIFGAPDPESADVDGAGIGDVSIIDDGHAAASHGDAPGLEPEIEIKNLKLQPPTFGTDPNETSAF